MSIRISTGAMNSILSTGSLKGAMANGVLCIYSGRQPSNADSAETGELLASINVDGDTFVPGDGVGLNLDTASEKSISKVPAEVWRGDYVVEGTMGWFRFYDNNKTTGESDTAIRIDGSVGTSRADIVVTSVQSSIGGSITLDTFTLNFSVLN